MSQIHSIQDATGNVIVAPAYGVMMVVYPAAPTASTVGYGPGCIYVNPVSGVVYRNSGSVTSSTWEIVDTSTANYLTGVVPGTVTASKALVVDASKALDVLTITGAFTPTGGIVAAGGFSATPCGQINTGGYPAIVSTYGTDSTPTTTSVYVVEIFIPCNMTITGVNYLNGSAVGNGTVKIGLYTSAGVAIAAALTAAVTTAGIDSYQAVPFATPYAAVGPAKYLIGFQFSSGTDRYNTHISGFTQGFGIAQASATVGVTAISPVPTAVVAGAAVVASLY